MKKYKATFIFAEHEEFDVPQNTKEFVIFAIGIEDAVKRTDKYLYNNHAILNQNDYTDYDYDFDGTRCTIDFPDAEAGMTLKYELEEV